MTDWIAVLLGEDGESGDEERLVLDGASEGVRLAPLRPPGAEDEVEPAEAPGGDGPDWTDGPEGLPGETDWAQVRADGPEGAVWSEELDPETGRTVWTLARAGLGRETDGAWDAGTEADGAAGPGRRPANLPTVRAAVFWEWRDCSSMRLPGRRRRKWTAGWPFLNGNGCRNGPPRLCRRERRESGISRPIARGASSVCRCAPTGCCAPRAN